MCVWFRFYATFNNFSVVSQWWLLVSFTWDSSSVLSAVNTDTPCLRHKSIYQLHYPDSGPTNPGSVFTWLGQPILGLYSPIRSQTENVLQILSRKTVSKTKLYSPNLLKKLFLLQICDFFGEWVKFGEYGPWFHSLIEIFYHILSA